jgi:hypothetical protein
MSAVAFSLSAKSALAGAHVRATKRSTPAAAPARSLVVRVRFVSFRFDFFCVVCVVRRVGVTTG